MKKLIYLLGLAMLMAVAACSGSAEKKKSDIRVLMQDSTDAHGVQRMTALKSEVNIKAKSTIRLFPVRPMIRFPGW